MNKTKKIYKLIILIIVMMLPLVLNANDIARKQVIVVQSYNNQFPYVREIQDGINNVSKTYKKFMDINTVYIDLDKEGFKESASRLKMYLSNFSSIDGLIVVDSPAYDVLTSNEFISFRNVPIVIVSNDDIRHSNYSYFKNTILLNEEVSIGPTLSLAVKLYPQARNVYVLTNSNSEVYHGQYMQIAESFNESSEYNIEFVDNMKYEDFVKFVDSIRNESIIILGSYEFSDGSSNFNIEIPLKLLSNNKNNKIFTIYKHHILGDVIGGSAVDFNFLGQESVRLIMELISKSSIKKSFDVVSFKNEYYFNNDALKKLNISRDKLPLKKEIIGLSNWKKEKTSPIIIIILTILIIFSLLVTILVFHYKISSLNQKRRNNNILEVLRFVSEKLSLGFWCYNNKKQKIKSSKYLSQIIDLNDSGVYGIDEVKSFLDNCKFERNNIDAVTELFTKGEHERPFTYINKQGLSYNLTNFWKVFDDTEHIFGVVKNNQLDIDKKNELDYYKQYKIVLIENSNDCIIITNSKGGLLNYNDSAQKLVNKLFQLSNSNKEDSTIIENFLKTYLSKYIQRAKFKKQIKDSFYVESISNFLEVRITTYASNYDKEIIIIIKEQFTQTNYTSFLNIIDKNNVQSLLSQNISFWEYSYASKEFAFSKNVKYLLDIETNIEQLSKTEILKIINSKIGHEVYSQIRSHIEDNKKNIYVKAEYKPNSTSIHWLKIVGKRVFNSNLNCYLIVGIIEDITETEEIKHKTEQVLAELDERDGKIKELNSSIESIKQEIENKYCSKVDRLLTEIEHLNYMDDSILDIKTDSVIKKLITGIYHKVNEPMSVLNLAMQSIYLELEDIFVKLYELSDKLSTDEWGLVSSLFKEVIKSRNKVDPDERIDENELLDSETIIENSSAGSSIRLSNLIVLLGYQSRLKEIKSLTSSVHNIEIFTLLVNAKNLIKLITYSKFSSKKINHSLDSLKLLQNGTSDLRYEKRDLISDVNFFLEQYSFPLSNRFELITDFPKSLEFNYSHLNLKLVWEYLLDYILNKARTKKRLTISIQDEINEVHVSMELGSSKNKQGIMFGEDNALTMSLQNYDKIELDILLAEKIINKHNGKMRLFSKNNMDVIEIRLPK